MAGSKAEWKALPAILLVIFCSKLAWIIYNGVLYEDDSVGYLTLHAGLYHPPGYGIFTSALIAIAGNLYAVVVTQSLLFSACASIAITSILKTPGFRLAAAIALGADLASGILVSSILSESVFMSLGLLISAIAFRLPNLPNRKQLLLFLLAGILTGMAYMMRYAGLSFLIILPLFLVFSGYSWRKIILSVVFVVLGFQLALTPLRLYYKSEFDTWLVNAFGGMSLWNTAAHLYPGSSVEENPESEFEKFLTGVDKEQFHIQKSFETAHIYSVPAPFPAYLESNKPDLAEITELSGELKSISIRLISENPFRHIRDFLLPNAAKPFLESEIPVRNSADMWFESEFQYHNDKSIRWKSWYWILLFTLLVMGTFLPLRSPNFAGRTMIAFTWFYLFAILLLSAVYLRFVFVLSPFIILLLCTDMESRFRKKN